MNKLKSFFSKINFSISLMLIFFFFVFTVYYLLADIKSSSAKNKSILYEKLLYGDTSSKYMIIPNVSQTIENINKNNFLESYLNGTMNDISASPIVALGYLGSMFHYLPVSFKKIAMKKIFTGGMYYSSTSSGFSLLFETNRFGKKIFSKLKSKIETKHFFVDQYEQWIILTSKKKILHKQLSILKGKKYYTSEKLPLSKGINIYWNPYKSSETNEYDLFTAFFKTAFPKQFFNKVKINITFTKQGIHIQSKNMFNKEDNETMYDFKQQLKSNLVSLKVIPFISKKNSFFMELGFDISDLKNYFVEGIFNNNGSYSKSTKLSLTGLINDTGLLIPEVALSWNNRSKEARFVYDFFSEAFYNMKYKKIEKNNSIQLKYPKYSYYRKNKKYYKFSPIIDDVNYQSIWASTSKAYNKMLDTIKNSKRKNELKTFKNFKNHYFKNKKIIGGFYSHLGELVKNIEPAIKEMYPIYYVESYNDFKENLHQYISKFRDSNLIGLVSAEKDFINTEVDINL